MDRKLAEMILESTISFILASQRDNIIIDGVSSTSSTDCKLGEDIAYQRFLID